jgi:hypothetical protein
MLNNSVRFKDGMTSREQASKLFSIASRRFKKNPTVESYAFLETSMLIYQQIEKRGGSFNAAYAVAKSYLAQRNTNATLALTL